MLTLFKGDLLEPHNLRTSEVTKLLSGFPLTEGGKEP